MDHKLQKYQHKLSMESDPSKKDFYQQKINYYIKFVSDNMHINKVNFSTNTNKNTDSLAIHGNPDFDSDNDSNTGPNPNPDPNPNSDLNTSLNKSLPDPYILEHINRYMSIAQDTRSKLETKYIELLF